MNAAVATPALRWSALADIALKAAARFWFVVAVAGQWIFVAYIALHYGGSAMLGDVAAWNRSLPHGYEAGNTIGNIALAGHLLFAASLTFAGALQLVPQIRGRYPAFHRWNGRIFVVSAFVMGVIGLYFAWAGRVVGGPAHRLAIDINAVLMMLCVVMAWRYALARDFATHRRWALRLFLLVNGTWFFRIGLMFWILVNQGPVGFDPKTFTGPFITFLAYANYVVPLAVLEIYLRAQRGGGASGRLAIAGGLVVLTVAMGVGIFGATVGLWLPVLGGARAA